MSTREPELRLLWMEHTLSSNLQADLSVWFGANPAVPAACTDGRGMQTAEGCTKNGWTTSRRSASGPRRSRTASQGECVPYYRWVSDYIGVIGGR
jgi:putative spermidine/putrescine transport system substrate-binding protein